jgi:hypothetical protein
MGVSERAFAWVSALLVLVLVAARAEAVLRPTLRLGVLTCLQNGPVNAPLVRMPAIKCSPF